MDERRPFQDREPDDDPGEDPVDASGAHEVVDDDAYVDPHAVPARRRPSRAVLAITLFPIVTIMAIGTIINIVFRAYLTAEHPLLLLMNDPRTINMLLVESRLDWWSYYPVVIIRRLIADPSHFLLGYWFGRSAIQWIKRHSPELGDMAVKLEGWFPRFGWLLVLVYPHALVMVIAGASTMRFRTFFALDFIGVLVAAIAVDLFGDLIEPQVKWLNSLISDYWIPLTIFSIGLFLLMYVISGRKEPRQTTGSIIDELESGDGGEPRRDR